jgi:hypothetical protein
MYDNNNFSVTAREMEPGYTMFFFQAAPRITESRLHCLLFTFGDWCREHPERIVSDLQIVKDKDLVRALNVFWFSPVESSVRQDFNFQVHKDVTDKYGTEYLEALMEDTAKFIVGVNQPHDVCALISRRDVVIVAYRRRKEGQVLEYEKFRKSLARSFAESVDKSFAEFKRSDAPGYHVIPLPDAFVASMA